MMHPQITLGRVLLADTIVSTALGVLMFVGIAPYFLAEVRHAGWIWELLGVVFGLGLCFALIPVGRRLKTWPFIGWLSDTYVLAKSREDLSRSLGKLNFLESAIALPFVAVPIFATFVPLIPFIRYAYSTWDWFDSVLGAILLLLPIVAFLPLLIVSMRLGCFVAIHVARRITGSPRR